MATKADVADIAEMICGRFTRGGRGTTRIGSVIFNLSDTAMCARFVRECHEAALGDDEYTWAYRAANARQMEEKLKDAGKITTEPERGDVICFNINAGKFGHIGIYLGGDRYAENTSSRRRGRGFVISTLDQIGRHRISGYYAPMPGAGNQLVKLIEHSTGEVVGRVKMVPGGDHITDQRKLYITKGVE